MSQRRSDKQPARSSDHHIPAREGQQQTEQSPAPFDVEQAGLLDWQRVVGNQALQRLLVDRSNVPDASAAAAATRRLPGSLRLLQTKLTVGEPDDEYEQEADDVANEVMRMGAPQDDGDTSGTLPHDATPAPQHRRIATVEDEAESTTRVPIAEQEAIHFSSAEAPQVQLLRARGLVSAETEEITEILTQVEGQLGPLEQEALITTEEVERLRERIAEMRSAVGELRQTRETTRPDARRIWLQGRRLLRVVRRMAHFRGDMRRRAREGRSTERLRLISDFRVTPRTIRVHEGESARIGFIVQGTDIRSVSGFILSHEGGGDVATSHRFFNWRDPEPGYKEAIWDGTFTGSRSRPPHSATYRVHVMVSSESGRTEQAIDFIRVENPDEETVLPRTQSGLRLQSLIFDGHEVVLTDERGNEIRARAVSGLRPNNPRNRTRIDYTRSQYQWERGRGPIPEGTYTIRQHGVQQPEVQRGRLVYPSGGTAGAWGPNRIPLYPQQVRNRSQFFVHLDVTDDGTAGCIGIHPGDMGKFNQMMALIMWMPNDSLPVQVQYGQ